MTRTEAIKQIMYLMEGYDEATRGNDIYHKCVRHIVDKKNVRFSFSDKDFLAYKFEDTNLTREEVEALELITGSEDWLKNERTFQDTMETTIQKEDNMTNTFNFKKAETVLSAFENYRFLPDYGTALETKDWTIFRIMTIDGGVNFGMQIGNGRYFINIYREIKDSVGNVLGMGWDMDEVTRERALTHIEENMDIINGVTDDTDWNGFIMESLSNAEEVDEVDKEATGNTCTISVAHLTLMIETLKNARDDMDENKNRGAHIDVDMVLEGLEGILRTGGIC